MWVREPGIELSRNSRSYSLTYAITEKIFDFLVGNFRTFLGAQAKKLNNLKNFWTPPPSQKRNGK